MLIKKIKLKNIRSYKDEEISLPEGIVLLSGDIGSGKSTVLLAIEFALFGLLRGELTGSALLRHGANEASIELTFSINNKEYTIKRGLKKSSKSIEQSAGHILINGVKKDATPTELKSEILNILGYPAELLSKSKSLIYRYTLYTPQEEMKRILFENEEDRLKILRKVFDIDKYERIKQNAVIHNRTIKEKIKHNQGKIFDKKEKEETKNNIIKEIEETDSQINILKPKIELVKEELNKIKKELEQVEKTKQKADSFSNEIQIAKIQKKSKEQNIEEKTSESSNIQNKITQLKEEITEIKEDVRQEIEKIKQKIFEKEKEINDFKSEITAFSTKKNLSKDTKLKISQLSECPTCLQEVSDEHKQKIINIEDFKVEEINKKIDELENNLKNLEQELIDNKNVLENLLQREKEIAVQKLKNKQLQELLEKDEKIKLNIAKNREEIQIIIEKIATKEKELEPLLIITNTYEKIKNDHLSAVEKERALAVQQAAVTQKKVSLQKQLSDIEKELKLKEEIEKKLEKLQKTLHWSADFFIPLMDTIEKQVMARIHYEFNSLFQEWFSMLIEDDLMSAKINENFTPIIEQNNFETEINSLSGGEKTACALAYRLALNKTINKVLSMIKTKDLLILDEPTDGFSSEQLDKMRDVLEQLNLKQIIIVSHEQKIEGFADKIIRVNKEEHVSSLISEI